MLNESELYCPDCDNGFDIPEPQLKRAMKFVPTRREFMGAVGVGAAAMVAGSAATRVLAEDAPAEKAPPKPAEALIREFHESLSAEQKQQFVHAWDHKRDDGGLTRLGTYNSAVLGNKLGDRLSKPQQELVERIVKSILSGNDAWERITRYGTWDSSGSFEQCGCAIFGEPADDKKFSWVFSGHHLTLRCDGNSEPGAAFGGPIYYGHSVGGYNVRNVYWYQTKQVQAVFDALDADQQTKAIAQRNPGDGARGIQFEEGQTRPGIAYADLSSDQQQLVASVMRTLLAPFRKADADEVMEIVKANGGMEKIHLAFYKDTEGPDDRVRWNFWRLEGPHFIWNYRPLPHVHCFVNIANV